MKAHRDAKWWSTAAALVAVVAATGSDGAGTPASGQTPTCKDGVIKVGAVSTITGPANFGEVPKAAKAVFDKVNAQGGISGCMVDYTIADDRGDPQVAAQVARELVDNKEITVLAGSASLLDCNVNAGFYDRKGIQSIHGLGTDPACFNSPSISPANVGPYNLSTGTLYYASNTLKLERLCAFFVIVGGTTEAYKTAIANWEKLSGRKVHLLDVTPPPGGDFTPFILKFRDRGCQAVVTNVIEPNVVQWVKTAEAQRIKGIDWLFLAPGYTAQVAKALAGTNQSVYAATEWEPFTGSASPAIKEWRAAMTEGGLALTAFTQGGYLAGTILVQILRGINGPVTRESVTNALRSMKAINHPLVGTPYYFGPGRTHASLKAVKIVKLVGDNWQVATPNWIVLP